MSWSLDSIALVVGPPRTGIWCSPACSPAWLVERARKDYTVHERVPTQARLELAHAAVQVVADTAAIEVLHIKGLALDPGLVWEGRKSSDADVLVHPKRVDELVTDLVANGYDLRGHFASSSAFEHSATLHHPFWGYVDVHRTFPGFGDDSQSAFAHLWEDAGTWLAAGVACRVPSIAAQRIILMLHAARSHNDQRGQRDTESAWHRASLAEREEVIALAHTLGADVGVAAALGMLDEWTHHPEHDLWVVVSKGGTRIDEWRARVKAARGLGQKARVVLRAPMVNVDHLAMVRGHEPTFREIAVEFLARPARGLREEWRRRGSR
jgi:hypothetical protein